MSKVYILLIHLMLPNGMIGEQHDAFSTMDDCLRAGRVVVQRHGILGVSCITMAPIHFPSPTRVAQDRSA